MTRLKKRILYYLACDTCGAQAPEIDGIENYAVTKAVAEDVALEHGFHFSGRQILCEQCWSTKEVKDEH